MGPLPDPPANPAMGRKPMQNLRRFKRVTATINGVFPMPASAWVGKPSRQASGARSRNLRARHSGIARDYLSTAKCPVGPTFPRICPLFETQRKRSIAAARKAADGGIAQDRSQGGPHVPRLCGRTPLQRRGFGRRTRASATRPTPGRPLRFRDPAEALVALLPTRRRVGPMSCCASTRRRSGVTPARRQARPDSVMDERFATHCRHFGTKPNCRQREDSGQQRARHRSRFPIGHSRIIIRRR
jgi:hypothetical protein